MDLSLSAIGMPSALLRMEVVSVRCEAEDVVAIELRKADAGDLPCFTAGSHIDVHLSNGVVRQYSLFNDPAEVHRYCIAVLKDPKGRGGSAAVHSLRRGDRLMVSAPRNLFPLHQEAAQYVLLAGGIGVTPIASMAQALAREMRDFHIHYFVRTRPRAALLCVLENFPDRVTLHVDNEQGPADLGALLQKCPARSRLYFCGPNGFMVAVDCAARKVNWPSDRLHKEHFSPVDMGLPIVKMEDRPFSIRLARSGRVVNVAVGQTAADALASAGVHVGVSCGQGICGACATTVIAGVPDHRDFVLGDGQRAAGTTFTPCCSRSLSEELVLDL